VIFPGKTRHLSGGASRLSPRYSGSSPVRQSLTTNATEDRRLCDRGPSALAYIAICCATLITAPSFQAESEVWTMGRTAMDATARVLTGVIVGAFAVFLSGTSLWLLSSAWGTSATVLVLGHRCVGSALACQNSVPVGAGCRLGRDRAQPRRADRRGDRVDHRQHGCTCGPCGWHDRAVADRDGTARIRHHGAGVPRSTPPAPSWLDLVAPGSCQP